MISKFVNVLVDGIADQLYRHSVHNFVSTSAPEDTRNQYLIWLLPYIMIMIKLQEQNNPWGLNVMWRKR
jgi:hypothetical protein